MNSQSQSKETVIENADETQSLLDCLKGNDNLVDQSSSMYLQTESFHTLHRRPLIEATHKLAMFHLGEGDARCNNWKTRDPAVAGTPSHLMSEVRHHDLREFICISQFQRWLGRIETRDVRWKLCKANLAWQLRMHRSQSLWILRCIARLC